MHYVVEDTPLGTAGAVKMAHDLLADDTFLVISGDALTDIDLTAMMAHHRAQGNDVTIALQRVTNPLEFGVVVTDEAGRIVRFLEKPSWGEVFSDTINTGIYVLEPSILDRMQRGKVYDFSKDLFPEMLREGAKLGGYVIDAYWTDIGNLEQYQQANYDAVEGRVGIEFPGTQVAPNLYAGEGTRIDPEARLEGPVVLGETCESAPTSSIVGRRRARRPHDRRARRGRLPQRAVGRRLRRRGGVAERLHGRRPQHRREARQGQREHRARARLHDRRGRDRERAPQAVARQVGDAPARSSRCR